MIAKIFTESSEIKSKSFHSINNHRNCPWWKFFKWNVQWFQNYAMPTVKKGATAFGEIAIDSLTNKA